MNWAQPGWFLLLLPLAVLALVVAGMARLHLSRLTKAFGGALIDQILPSSVRVRRALSATATLVGLLLVVVSLAEPRFDKQIRTMKASGVDLVLVVDLSRSMDAKDVEPSRLERARREITDLFRVLQSDRVGLVVYAGSAFPRLPLTEDLGAVQLVLSEMDTTTFDAQGSALGSAIRSGVKLATGSSSPAGKALLILSDGEVHENDDALVAAQEAADAGVTIYAMGIGEQTAPIPVPGGWLTWKGEQVMTTPDDTVLKEVARMTGGAYVKSVASPADVVGLYEGEMRQKLQVVERDAQQRETWRSAFQYPLTTGLMLLLLGAWLGDGQRAFGAVTAVLVAVLALSTSTPAVAGTLAEADRLYREGAYDAAARELTELSLEQPTNPGIHDRLGAARYRAGDYDGAARAWETAGRLTGGTDTRALYNAGNAHWKAGRLEEAAERFGDVLAQDPGHVQAQKNADVVNKEIAARRQIQPPPPPEPKPGEDEEDEGGGDQQDEQQEDQGGTGDREQDDPSQGGDPSDSSESAEDGNPEGGDPEATPDLDDVAPGEDEGESEDDEGEPEDQVGAGGGGGEDGEEQEITVGQAERMLDSVEEGTQKLRVPGPPGGKPW